MGQVSSTGYDENVNTNIETKEEERNSNETLLNKINDEIENKLNEFNKLLLLLIYYINIKVLNKSFLDQNKIRINILDKKINKLLQNIKKEKQLYIKKIRDYKDEVVKLENQKKKYNVIYYVNIILGIILLILVINYIRLKKF